MSSTKVSVIVPAYNQAAYIAEAIHSVVNQSYSNWELIIVDDGSTDATAEVARQFDDPRIRYLYQTNRGLPGARNTGITHSTGEYLAFLDADDLYHSDKLAVQVAHLNQNTDVGMSYTSRIAIEQSGAPLKLSRAPETVSLATLVLGFPFVINDILIRRNWVEQVSGFDESFLLNSEDRDFYLRLALSGCSFAGVTRALSYRRLHAGRVFKKIPEKMSTYFRALETAFADPRCPPEVLKLRDTAYGEIYKVWTYQALVQGEPELGRAYLQKTMQLNPTVLNDKALSLLKFFIWSSIRDGGNHEEALRLLFSQLPPELVEISEQESWAVAQGYFLRAIRDVMWKRVQQAQKQYNMATDLGFSLDDGFLPFLTDQVVNYEAEFGPEATHVLLQDLTRFLNQGRAKSGIRRLYSNYAINRALAYYRTGHYTRVPGAVIQAVSRDPRHLGNRGVLSITLRSILGLLRQARA